MTMFLLMRVMLSTSTSPSGTWSRYWAISVGIGKVFIVHHCAGTSFAGHERNGAREKRVSKLAYGGAIQCTILLALLGDFPLAMRHNAIKVNVIACRTVL
jgi:hypothetical protein